MKKSPADECDASGGMKEIGLKKIGLRKIGLEESEREPGAIPYGAGHGALYSMT
jgi:hypothetical protein